MMTHTTPELPEANQPGSVKDCLVFYALVNGYYTPEGLARVTTEKDELESLREVISATLDTELSEEDIIAGLHTAITEIR